MQRYLGAIILGAALLSPPLIWSEDHSRRYYDRDHKDYHHWDEREEQAYRRYLQEQKREYRAWHKIHSREQQNYWRWRHEHL